MEPYLLGIDLGSGSTRAALYTPYGRLVAIATRPTEKVVPDLSRRSEIVWPHDRIWDNGCAVIREVTCKLPPGGRIEAVAVACLGMDGLPIDEDGNALYPFISWHDNRTVSLSERWQREFGDIRQFQTTGNKIHTFNTAFRLQWMAQNEPEILARTAKWVLIGDYFNFKLCGRLATDYTMANCTLLFDPRTKRWSEEILRAAEIDGGLLCDPMPSGTLLGPVNKQAAAATGLPEGTPVVLGAHDYLCSVLPIGGYRPGTIVNVAGTWDIVQTSTREFAPEAGMAHQGLTLECHAAPGTYSILGDAVSGGVLDWYRTEFGPAYLGQEWDAVQEVALNEGDYDLIFLPHLAGASCPELDAHASGALIGLRDKHTRKDVLAAVLRGLAFQNAKIVQTLENCTTTADRFVLVGGGARVGAAVQLRANVLGRAVEISPLEETTALGAALIAGVGTGFYADLDAAYAAVHRPTVLVEPEKQASSQLAELQTIYAQLYELLKKTNHALSKDSQEARTEERGNDDA